MPTTISYMTANEVARQLGHHMPDDWGQGDRASNEHYRPLETYGARLDELFARARGLGFEAVDLWDAHLNPSWATDVHVAIARELLDRHGLAVASLAGWFGSTPEEFERACEIAVAIGAPVLGGGTALLEANRAALVEALERHDLRFGLENHPEPTPSEVRARIDGLGERVGATVDTGWFATQGYDAARAIEELGERVVHVHLKDVLEVGRHRTCAYGAGVVPLQACVAALAGIGYRGSISVEHEPDDHDPSDEIADARRLLGEWLTAAAA
jgi:sugar phosphate isomerase/epimerase